MISFFRKALSSWIVLGLLALIMLAFIVTGVGTPSGLGNLGGGASGDTIAKVGNDSISTVDITQRAQLALQSAQQQQPELDMPAFVKGGGIDNVVRQVITARALEIWARNQGLAASKRLVDGDIASITAFHGLSGKFDEGVFRNALAQRRITETQLRRDMTGDAIRRQLLIPVAGGNRAPESLVIPYASLMLELRKGQIGIVPSQLMPPGAQPTEADINAWYSRNLARYTMPERRVIRFALFGKDQLKALSKPSEAEITAFFNANPTVYGSSETRSFSQVVLPDEAAANAFAAKLKGGMSFTNAAQEAGFAPNDTALGEQTRAQLTALASAQVASAAYAAPQGANTPPLKSALGWHVLHIDSVQRKAARPLAAAHDEIAAALEKQKTDEALTDLATKIENEIADGSSFDDVIKAHALTVTNTPPILPSGQAPENPDWKSPPELQILLKTAFEAAGDDDPTVENIGKGALHAVLKVGQVVPAAPIALAKIRDRVSNDLLADRAFERARTIANAIVAKANAGVPFAKAIAEAGVKLPAPQTAGGRQIELVQSKRPVPPPLALMFSIAPGNTKTLEAPDKQGWFLVHLDSIEKGNAATAPDLIAATRNEFSSLQAQEYIEQFAHAVESEVSVKRNDPAIARVKSQLAGSQ